MISEVLVTRDVVLSRSEDLSVSRIQSVRNAKSVYNLLTLILSSLRQYQLLSTIYERAMKFVNQDSYLWEQLALSLLCRGRWTRAARVLEQAVSTTSSNDGSSSCAEHSSAIELMMLSQLYIERFSQYDSALTHAEKALAICGKDGQQAFLMTRCQLLQAIAMGQRAQQRTSWEQKRSELVKTLRLMEDVVAADAHDYLALYYAALYHAISRDLEAARERCARSLELNSEQPAAIMLLALVFTAHGDLKGALELVVNALKDFPNNYGLLVLRLHIETKFGRVEESLDTCSHLLDFWKRRDNSFSFVVLNDEDRNQTNLNASDGTTLLREGSTKTGTPSLGRDMTPVTPLISSAQLMGFTAPVLNTTSTTASAIDLSVIESGVAPSEVGGTSTASDSGASCGGINEVWSKFKAQADIWMSLAELYLAEGKQAEVGRCVEQAVNLFPHSPQAMYLKGRLLNCRAEKIEDELVASKLRSEAKAAYLSALALCPAHVPTMSHLAKLYAHDGNLKMSEHLYRELVRLEPLCCEWWQQLGCSLMRLGKADQATECLTAASQLDRTTPLLPFSVIPLVFPTSF
ncbi:unnamed protein product [Caenorhabditis auriculariae]|uniref:Tetratricopeptide repeat protein 7 N-terminal domain-containing protein n=1 Tax=Caenorhabditis auriculariae TaxID=2777116 RepID=A0A8S1HN03_9PELO|nr:unnamed protein product [Caenorhabditis auriculariae]